MMKSLRIASLFFTLILSACFASAQDTTKHQNGRKVVTKNVSMIVTQTDNTPDEIDKFDTYIKKHKRDIPGANGVVEVGFTNEEDGSITHVKIVKGLTKAADEEALRLVKAYPRWEPNLFEGKPQSSTLTMSITFGKNKKIVSPQK